MYGQLIIVISKKYLKLYLRELPKEWKGIDSMVWGLFPGTPITIYSKIFYKYPLNHLGSLLISDHAKRIALHEEPF